MYTTHLQADLTGQCVKVGHELYDLFERYKNAGRGLPKIIFVFLFPRTNMRVFFLAR